MTSSYFCSTTPRHCFTHTMNTLKAHASHFNVEFMNSGLWLLKDYLYSIHAYEKMENIGIQKNCMAYPISTISLMSSYFCYTTPRCSLTMNKDFLKAHDWHYSVDRIQAIQFTMIGVLVGVCMQIKRWELAASKRNGWHILSQLSLSIVRQEVIHIWLSMVVDNDVFIVDIR